MLPRQVAILLCASASLCAAGCLDHGLDAGPCLSPPWRHARGYQQQALWNASLGEAPRPLALDESAAPRWSDIERLVPLEADAARRFLVLSPHQTQCLAAANSTGAYLLALDAQLAASGGKHGRPGPAEELQSQLLWQRQRQERNRDAATALDVYHRLAQAQLAIGLLRGSVAEIDKGREFLSALEGQRLPLPDDARVWDRERWQTLRRQAALLAQIEQANANLQLLLGLPPAGAPPVWPQTDLVVRLEPFDLEEAIAVGMAHRPDLAMLRLVHEQLNGRNLGAARAALQMMQLGAGQSVGKECGLLQKMCQHGEKQEELAIRRKQVAALLASQERKARQEIHAAAEDLTSRARQAAAAQETLDLRRRRVAHIEQLRGLGKSSAFELVEARLAVLQTQSELLEQIVSWNIALVRLKEAQGLLDEECGLCGGACQPPGAFAIPLEAAPLEDAPAEIEPAEIEPAEKTPREITPVEAAPLEETLPPAASSKHGEGAD